MQFIFPRLTIPKATKNVMTLAGLLACSIFVERLPKLFGSVAKSIQIINL
jgi:hypothetical protein